MTPPMSPTMTGTPETTVASALKPLRSKMVLAMLGLAACGARGVTVAPAEVAVVHHRVAADVDAAEEQADESTEAQAEEEETLVDARREHARDSAVLAFTAPCHDGACVPGDELDFTAKDLRRIRRALPHIARASAKYGVDPALVSAVIWVESRYFNRARGPRGAEGLMQLMPVTSQSLAERMDCKPAPWRPAFSIHAGTLFLSRLLARTQGDEIVALAAYSRGLPRVRRYIRRGRTLPTGTRKYVGNVQQAKAAFERAFADGTLKLPKVERRRQQSSDGSVA